jgi:dolichol kinase
VIFVLTFYPRDIAIVSILMYVLPSPLLSSSSLLLFAVLRLTLARFLPFAYLALHLTRTPSLSWADTSASTIGRLFSSSPYNPKLPRRIFFNTIPIARSKSLVGFLAAWLTGLAIGVGYYGGIDEYGGGRSRGGAVDWRVLEWKRGVALTGMMVGAVAAVTEALGQSPLSCATRSSRIVADPKSFAFA